jgi:glycosyltransferase involved in cell wall biosynthesis
VHNTGSCCSSVLAKQKYLSPLKIIHVLPAFTKGGAEIVAVRLANWAADVGWEVAFVTAFPVDPSLLMNDLRPDIDVRHVASARDPKLLRYAKMLPWIAANRRWLFSADIVHCHLTFGSAFGTVLSGLRKLYRRRRPAILETYHAVGAPLPTGHGALHRWLARRQDGFVSMASDPTIAAFVRANPELPYKCIPNGIQLPVRLASQQEARAYRAALGIPDGVPVVGTIGRLVPDRRPAELMAVFAQVARQRRDVHFLIAGEGPERNAIEALARQFGFGDRLHMAGLVLGPAEPLSVMDLYVTLNVGRVTGVAGLEAAASGLPVVAIQTDRSHQMAGDWIHSSADLHEVATEVTRLLGSANELRELGVRQKGHVERHHSLEAMTNAYREFYATLLADRIR